jgi:hypothetical protein
VSADNPFSLTTRPALTPEPRIPLWLAFTREGIDPTPPAVDDSKPVADLSRFGFKPSPKKPTTTATSGKGDGEVKRETSRAPQKGTLDGFVVGGKD